MLDTVFSPNLHDFTSQLYGGVSGSSVASIITKEFQANNRTSVLVCASDQQAQETYNQIRFFNKTNLDESNILYLPGLETLPYDLESPHAELIADRAKVFYEVFSSTSQSNPESKLIVTSINSLVQKICCGKHWVESSWIIERNEALSIPEIIEHLSTLGYKQDTLESTSMATFFNTNDNIDIFSTSEEAPIRIKVRDGVVHSMKAIDINTQLTVGEEIETLKVLPAREIPVSAQGVRTFKINYRRTFNRAIGDKFYESVSHFDFPSGIESLLPLFSDTNVSLLEAVLPLDPCVYILDGAKESLEKYLVQINKRYNELGKDKTRPILPPNKVWLDGRRLAEVLNDANVFKVQSSVSEHDEKTFHTQLTNFTRKSNLNEIIEMLSEYTVQASKTIVFIHSDVRLQQVETLLSLLDKDVEICSSWDEALASDSDACIIEAGINVGFYDLDNDMLVVTEKEIFGQPIQAKDESGLERSAPMNMNDLKYLKTGDLVVHINNGIGRYDGLKVLSVNGADKEYFTINYADSAKVYVDLNDLQLVSRYSGADPEKIKLDRKDAKKWGAKVEQAVKHIQGTALQLLEAQAERAAKRGIVFDKPMSSYNRFCQEFPYQPTSDQIKVSTEIAQDLISPVPMDRLVAGDVGFGKTEIAMRTSFIAAASGYQTVVLAPSTILVHQHFESFKSRFANTPYKIVELSSSSNNKHALAQIKSGDADIIIGTHKAIQKSVKYHNLGLLIVDEEHRFGVKAKEQLRFISKDINILSMTATPIPRSLSMAMNGIRDMSVLAIPPAKRLSIRTQVRNKTNDVLVEAVERELLRDGQVFYVHNNTSTIDECADTLRAIFPSARICVGHGKMSTQELETVMSAFYKHEYDILVATTIIETGIDVPNANTIIIEEAENFGVASLHQLRGRVGRSHHQGYAYLLRGKAANSETSIKRLNAMENATQLGDGFLLANHDLAIRGAGEILGEEQSGHMAQIGYELYDKIMQHALELIRDNGMIELTNKQVDSLYKGQESTQIDVGLAGLISPQYVSNEQLRLSLYRKISLVETKDDVEQIKAELVDRFGPLPKNTERLLEISKLKTVIVKLGINEIKLHPNGGVMKVSHAKESSHKLVDMVERNAPEMQLSTPFAATIYNKFENPDDRVNHVIKLIKQYASAK